MNAEGSARYCGGSGLASAVTVGPLLLPGLSGRPRVAARVLIEILPHPALRIEEEHARDDDPLARRQPLDDLHPVAEAPAGLHRTRLENSLTAVHENRLLQPGIE